MRENKLIRVGVLTLVLLALMAVPALAKVVSPGPDFYYLDDANVLSEDLEGEIFFANKLLYDACGAQIVVVTVDSTGRNAIDDYAYELFNSWGIGDAAKDNGFLLLLAIEDDDYYARTGSGLDRRFSASTIKEYYDEYLEQDFAARRYEEGVRKFFEAVYQRIATTYSADVTIAQGIAAYKDYIAKSEAGSGFGGYTRRRSAVNGDYRSYQEDDDSGIGFGVVLVVILLIVLVILVSKGRRARRRIGVMPPPPPPPMGIGYRPTRTVWPTGPSVRSGPPRSRPSSGGFFGGGASRPSSSFGGGFRSSSGRSSGFGGGFGGGGRSSGGGAGRGRH